MMKWILRILAIGSCLLLFGQVRIAVCQDQITAGAGETIQDLPLGLQNTGWSSYSAYAEAYGETASWCSPSMVDFGYIMPGQAKRVTYSLTIPSSISSGTYYVQWI